MADKKVVMKTEVVEDGQIESGKSVSVKEQLLAELAESNYSTSSLTYSQFITQAVDKVLG